MYRHPEDRYGKLYNFAMQFRQIGLEIDKDPSLIHSYCSLSGIQFLLSDNSSAALERTHYLEAFSYGDPGVLLASPGPSLSGLMIREIGTTEQIALFYELLKKHSMHTFFALTEPHKGSDASHIETRLHRSGGQYYLSGEKCFIGNGAIAKTGIVIAKCGDTTASLRAIWIKPALLQSSSIYRELIPVFPLKGAQLSYLRFDQVPVASSDILGTQLTPMKSGLLAIQQVFNKLRTGVGALALGQAQAVLDYCYENQLCSNRKLNKLQTEANCARHLLHCAAKQNPLSSAQISHAKLFATKTTERILQILFNTIPTELLYEQPWIMKAYRDKYCWEYMEGTSNILFNHMNSKLQKTMDSLKNEVSSV